jgi:hypothetical protein
MASRAAPWSNRPEGGIGHVQVIVDFSIPEPLTSDAHELSRPKVRPWMQSRLLSMMPRLNASPGRGPAFRFLARAVLQDKGKTRPEAPGSGYPPAPTRTARSNIASQHSRNTGSATPPG